MPRSKSRLGIPSGGSVPGAGRLPQPKLMFPVKRVTPGRKQRYPAEKLRTLPERRRAELEDAVRALVPDREVDDLIYANIATAGSRRHRVGRLRRVAHEPESSSDSRVVVQTRPSTRRRMWAASSRGSTGAEQLHADRTRARVGARQERSVQANAIPSRASRRPARAHLVRVKAAIMPARAHLGRVTASRARAGTRRRRRKAGGRPA